MEPARRELDPGRIRQLDPQVAEAIAAGEVVERPASLVKELVENSLDAGARRVAVEIDGGGADLVRVVDDGQGMTAGELLFAFRRHATSKLATVADLAQVRTFGFRGEALASIAAVARVTAVSRFSDSARGFEVQAAAGSLRGPVATAAPPGTTITARDLFFNLPARRTFLRSSRTEAAACARMVSDMALARPDVQFVLTTGGRTTLRTAGRGSLSAAVAAVVGPEAANCLLEVHHREGDLEVVGALCQPQLSRQTRQGMVLLVNGRRIHHRTLQAAVEGAYRGLLTGDRYPVVVLDVRCPTPLVDVNVHPTKREVRLREEGKFFELVQRACWEALQATEPRRIELPVATVPPPSSGLAQALPYSQIGPAPPGDAERTGPNGPSLSETLRGARGWRYLGQAHDRYLVLETGSGIALLDQHAVHEKILYERFSDALLEAGSDQQASQGLLDPVLIEVGPVALERFASARPALQRLGFEVEVFGPQTVRCSGAPLGVRLSDCGPTLLDLLESWETGGTEELRRHRLAASLACHAAVRFGDSLTAVEVEALLRDLASTRGGTTCPHGRPAVLLLSESRLLAAFHRS